MTWRGANGGRHVVVDDMYELDEVIHNAKLDVFFKVNGGAIWCTVKVTWNLDIGNWP